jgi:hypothetical protein
MLAVNSKRRCEEEDCRKKERRELGSLVYGEKAAVLISEPHWKALE